MQTFEGEKIKDAIPQGMKEIGAYPYSSLATCIRWNRVTERINCGDLITGKYLALIARGNADIWRIIYIVFLSLSGFFIFKLLLKLKVPKTVAIPLLLTFLFSPIGIWTDYKSAEAKGVLFLTLSFYFAFNKKLLVSFLFFTMAIFTKETFLSGIFFISGLYMWKPEESYKEVILKLMPFFVISVLTLFYFLFLRSNNTSGYVFYAIGTNFSLRTFFYNILNLFPVFIAGRPVLSAAGLFVLWFLFAFFSARERIFSLLLKRDRVLIFSLIFSLVFSVLPYLLTGRAVVDRYLIPANIFIIFIVAVIFASFYKWTSENERVYLDFVSFIVCVLIIISGVYFAVNHSRQDRLDQQAWQVLINDVAEMAPNGSHIILKFDDVGMVETAWSLEANTLFNGRYDLTYHLEIEDLNSLSEASDFSRRNIELFNLRRQPVSQLTETDVLYVRADRKGGTNLRPYINYQISLNKPI